MVEIKNDLGKNNIGDLTAQLLARLPLLTKLWIGILVDKLDETKITVRGLQAICTLNLTKLNIRKGDGDIGKNSCGD